MIELTVKTLDSQNHCFTVEDDITVADFKQKIAETINIPPDTQRIIYCGRVLKDDVKLSEYDVNGKVVHLVQRAPPSSTQTPNRPASPQAQRRNAREFEHGMYLGSMAFPSNLMDAQGIVPPPPTHSLAASRLNVAKRMLRKAEAALVTLENPGVRPSERTPPDEPQEEVTPVFEARVIVPNNSLNEPIDEVLTAVQNSLFNATAVVNGGQPVVLSENSVESGGSTANNPASTEMELPAVHSVSSTPEGASPASVSTENLAADTQRNGTNMTEGGSANTLAENASRTSEMADLLDTLGRLQVRFAPFLEQYHNFMRQDPTIPAGDARKTQAMINCVSEILHFLGHAYHSLSDIIVRVRTPAPRPLLCRPILIQHSAVVQTGFPIQVEAQINFSPEGGATNSTQPATSTTSSATTTQQQATPSSTSTANILPPMGPTITTHIQPQMLGLPLLPGAVHVQSFPIEIRGIQRPTGNQNNSSTGSSEEAPAGDAPTTTSNGTATPVPPPTTTTANASGSQFNNPNMEFFMEVTPESITIDSLETASNDAVILRGALNGPPSDFLQSIMQMAEQIISRSGTPTTQPSSATSSEPSTTQQATQNTTQPQNSQARGNTQTNPTTSTHTRSTPRPHVHLAQHTMQGFDPFLPCNSHHVTPRRRVQARTLVQQQGNQNNNGRQETSQQNNAANPIYNIVQGIVNSFRNVYRQRNPGGQGSSSATQSAENIPEVNTMTNGQTTPPPPPPPLPGEPVLPPQHPLSTLNMNLSISQILQRFSDINYTEGENVFTDLIMLLLRNLTIRDLMLLNSSRLDPLLRIRNEIRNFFLYQLLDGTNTVASVDRGVNRLINEMQPFWNNFQHLEVRDDIDIVRSIEMLFRTRLPNIISLAASHNPNSLRMLVEQCRITLRQLCALIVHASAEGLRRIDEVIDLHLVRRYLGIPRDIDMLRTYLVSRAYLRRFLSSLSVPESILQPYIVRRVDSAIILPPVAEPVQISDDEPIGEPMELDEQEASGSSNELGGPLINLQEDLEPLPAVDIGSDSWHNQVPADWVPIIVRDTQRQRRQNPQPAFSDAYLSGMPSKRRKIVTSSKPQGTLPQVIQDSVRHAVTASGLTTVAPLDTVSEAAAADINIQSAYRELLRSSVQSNLQNNEDFTPERFPNATNYFSKPQ